MKTKAAAYREAVKVGGFSLPSKMPCHSYSIPAAFCKVGAELAKIAGTPCAICYAKKGRYVFPVVQAAMMRRYESLNRFDWVNVMAACINRLEGDSLGSGFFRWHDSGDLQSVDHLAAIVRVCTLTPSVKHWLPTRERLIVREYLNNSGTIPGNLCVRFSGNKVDHPTASAPAPCTRSEISTDASKATCPAPKQGGSCLDCRACWDRETEVVTYRAH